MYAASRDVPEFPGNIVAALLLTLTFMLPKLSGAQEFATFDAGSDNRLGLTFSADGDTAFWVEWDGEWGSNNGTQRVIYTSRSENGRWSEPQPAVFTHGYSDDDPFVSPDGQWLYFVSERPVDGTDNEADANIWRYSLVEKDRLEFLPINSDAAEYSPVVTLSGALYFASARDGGLGAGDIYRAAPLDDGFAPPQNLGPAINSSTGEWNLWVSAEENELIFEASARPTNVSVPGDLYYSWHTPGGWTAAVPIGALNSNNSDLMPRLHPDGKTLLYTTAAIGGNARIETTDWAPLREELRSAYAPDLLVANRSSHEVTFVNLSLGEVVARVETGAGPHLLSNVSNDRVLATGYGEYPRPHAEPVSSRPPFVTSLNSRLTVIDTRERIARFDRVLEGCAKPHASWIVAPRAYVTCEPEQRVLVLDLDDGRINRHIDTRQEGSHVLGFEPRSRKLVVSNTDSGSITLINIDNDDAEVVTLAAGSEGSLVFGDRVWVGNGIDGSVSVVDIPGASVVKNIDSVCGFPISLSAGSQNQVWVACFASVELVAINNDTFVVERRISLDDQPLNLILHPTRELAYIALPRKNAIAEIDLSSGKEIRRITVGIEPDGLRWAE